MLNAMLCISSLLFHDCAGLWQVRMAEVVQTCTLLVTGRLEEVLDPVQQSRKYPAVQLDRLSAVLTKFRCVLMHLCNKGQSNSTLWTLLHPVGAVLNS